MVEEAGAGEFDPEDVGSFDFGSFVRSLSLVDVAGEALQATTDAESRSPSAIQPIPLFLMLASEQVVCRCGYAVNL